MTDPSPPAHERAAERTRTVSTDAGRVAYAEYGDPDGTPVVFLHGTPGSRLLAGLFHDAARERGVRVLAPDRPGYGESTPRPDRTFADTDALVAAVLDDADVSRAGVVGFSGGAPHALAVAATHPERVTSVDLVAAPAPPSLTDEQSTIQRVLGALATRIPRFLKWSFRAQAWVAERAPPSFVVTQYTTGGPPDNCSDADAALVARDFAAAFAHSRQGAVTESRLLARDWGLPLANVDCDVRFWHGDEDTNAPVEGARALADRLPNADLAVLGTDHLGALLDSRTRILDHHARQSPGPP